LTRYLARGKDICIGKGKRKKESIREQRVYIRAGQLDVTFVKVKYIYFFLRFFTFVGDDEKRNRIKRNCVERVINFIK